jgi:hypothetical protein
LAQNELLGRVWLIDGGPHETIAFSHWPIGGACRRNRGNRSSAEKKGTTPTYKPPKKVIVQALTDSECKNLGCKVFLDSGCKTDFGDNGSHTGHKCVCSSGSSCIDTAK